MRRVPGASSGRGGTHSVVETVRRSLGVRAVLCILACLILAILVTGVLLLVYALERTDAPKPSLRPRITTPPPVLTAPPATPPPSPTRTIDPNACIWTAGGNEVYAAVHHSHHPFWLALPVRDPRLYEVVREAQTGSVLEFSTGGERNFSTELLSSFGPGSVMIDIGADLGLFSLQLAAFPCEVSVSEHNCSSSGGRFTVVAFEPNRKRALLARQSMARNCFTNMIVSELALASQNGTAELRWPSVNPSAASLHPRLAPHMDSPLTLPVTTAALDQWLSEQGIPLERVRFIKLDVPSTALHILRGAFHTLRRPAVLYLLLTIDATLMRNLRDNPFELLALLTSAGMTLHFEGRTWSASAWPDLVAALAKCGECVLHCIKSPTPPREAPRLGGYML